MSMLVALILGLMLGGSADDSCCAPAEETFDIIALVATCTGADDCKACKTCVNCAHCRQEGKSCGVCRDKPTPQPTSQPTTKPATQPTTRPGR